MESGISQKMEKDITTSPHFGGFFDGAFWTRGNDKENKPLTIIQVAPSLMILGFGLIASNIIFITELILSFSALGMPASETSVKENKAETKEDKEDEDINEAKEDKEDEDMNETNEDKEDEDINETTTISEVSEESLNIDCSQ